MVAVTIITCISLFYTVFIYYNAKLLVAKGSTPVDLHLVVFGLFIPSLTHLDEDCMCLKGIVQVNGKTTLVM